VELEQYNWEDSLVTSPNQIDVTVVVNGSPQAEKANIHEPVHVLIKQALQDTGNSGQPIENWEMRDAAGQILDPTKKDRGLRHSAGSNPLSEPKGGHRRKLMPAQYADPNVSRTKFDRE